MVKNVVIDLGGTIVNTTDRMGDREKEELLGLARKKMKSQKVLDDYYGAVWDNWHNSIRIYPNAPETVNKFATHFKVFIATRQKRQSEVEEWWEKNRHRFGENVSLRLLPYADFTIKKYDDETVAMIEDLPFEFSGFDGMKILLETDYNKTQNSKADAVFRSWEELGDEADSIIEAISEPKKGSEFTNCPKCKSAVRRRLLAKHVGENH